MRLVRAHHTQCSGNAVEEIAGVVISESRKPPGHRYILFRGRIGSPRMLASHS
jgi:hypothetical protein